MTDRLDKTSITGAGGEAATGSPTPPVGEFIVESVASM